MNQKQIELECLLTEFRTLRSELSDRGKHLQAALFGNLAAVASVFPVAYGSETTNRQLVLLIVPFVSSVLGFYYLHHRLSAGRIGQYIRDYITPAINALADKDSIMKWETFIRERIDWPQELTHGFSVIAVFFLPAAAALIIVAEHAFTRGGSANVAWYFGLGFTVINLILWVTLYNRWWNK